jgi:hypothetical protein
MKIFYLPGFASNLGSISVLTHDQPLDLNELTAAAAESPYNNKFKTEMIPENVKWGTSYTRMSLLGNVRLYKPNSISGNNAFINDINLNTACV